jgi:3-dehydroquinate synthase
MIRVNLGPRSYDIAVNEAGGIGAFLEQRLASRRAYIFADANVAEKGESLFRSLTDAGFTCRTSTIPAGESSKSLTVAAALFDRLCDMAADRQTAVIAVGGGVVGDLAGFVAATYNRGLPWIMMPTTLLAMVDSSVGGKVGINLPHGKNLVGAFHQPAGVWIDTAALSTLPAEEYRAGLAEVVKYGVILDADFFTWLEQNADAVNRREPDTVAHVVTRCCQLKAQIVEKDEREETGQRIVLNYGHTFAHAFESVSGYTVRHGEAVAIGMVCASRLAERCGMIGPEVTQRQIELLKRFGLPVALPHPARIDEWLNAMKRDKKAAGGRMRFVLPSRIGEVVVVDDVGENVVRAILG